MWVPVAVWQPCEHLLYTCYTCYLLRSSTSCLRSTTSSNRSYTSQLRCGTFFLGSTTLHSLYLSIFLYARYFVKKNISHSWSLCHLHLPMLGEDRCWKRQTLFKSNAIKAKQSALNARKPLADGQEPHLCSQPFRLKLWPLKPRACRDPPPLAE